MIEKLDIKNGGVEDLLNCIKKINEVVDAVNELQEEAKNNARIRAGHEHKIEELQVNQNTYWTDIAELKKELQTRAENVQKDTESRPENVQKETFVSIDEALKNATISKKEIVDPYAEQCKWEGKLCWFWDEDPEDKIVDVLSCIDISDKYPYVMCDRQVHYKYCEPVKPDDDIIYKGGNNE